MMEWVDYLKRKSDYGQHLQIPSEMSAGACWDLARELEQFINTTPPQQKHEPDDLTIAYMSGVHDGKKQRTWVGLTDEEVTSSHSYSVTRDKGCFHAGAKWAEAKLKEKNFQKGETD